MTTAIFPKGLEGVVAAETELSYIDGQAGILEYVGIPIGELSSRSTFEETVFLLWNKRLPNQAELNALSDQISSLADVPQGIIDAIKATPKTAEPMHVLRTMVSMLAMYDPSPNDNNLNAAREKSLRILAQTPTLVAYFDRHRRGLDFVRPKASGSFAQNFLWMLNGTEPTKAMVSAFDKCMILHADHGLNNSTFTARVVISTLSDVYSAMSAAIGSLRGPLHGGANEGVMKMLNQINAVSDVEKFIMERIERKDKIMGFGHRVYKTKDPRAKDLQGLAKQLAEDTGNQDLYAKSSTIEKIMERELGAKGIYPNVDFYSATTYHCIGLKLDLFTPMFALSRIAGWAGHVLEQLDGNRLYRPTVHYVGPHDTPYIPMNQR